MPIYLDTKSMPPNTKNPSFNLNTNSFPRNAKNYTETIITQNQNHNHNPSFINRAKHTSANPKSQIPNIREKRGGNPKYVSQRLKQN